MEPLEPDGSFVDKSAEKANETSGLETEAARRQSGGESFLCEYCGNFTNTSCQCCHHTEDLEYCDMEVETWGRLLTDLVLETWGSLTDPILLSGELIEGPKPLGESIELLRCADANLTEISMMPQKSPLPPLTGVLQRAQLNAEGLLETATTPQNSPLPPVTRNLVQTQLDAEDLSRTATVLQNSPLPWNTGLLQQTQLDAGDLLKTKTTLQNSPLPWITGLLQQTQLDARDMFKTATMPLNSPFPPITRTPVQTQPDAGDLLKTATTLQNNPLPWNNGLLQQRQLDAGDLLRTATMGTSMTSSVISPIKPSKSHNRQNSELKSTPEERGYVKPLSARSGEPLKTSKSSQKRGDSFYIVPLLPSSLTRFEKLRLRLEKCGASITPSSERRGESFKKCVPNILKRTARTSNIASPDDLSPFQKLTSIPQQRRAASASVASLPQHSGEPFQNLTPKLRKMGAIGASDMTLPEGTGALIPKLQTSVTSLPQHSGEPFQNLTTELRKIRATGASDIGKLTKGTGALFRKLTPKLQASVASFPQHSGEPFQNLTTKLRKMGAIGASNMPLTEGTGALFQMPILKLQASVASLPQHSREPFQNLTPKLQKMRAISANTPSPETSGGQLPRKLEEMGANGAYEFLPVGTPRIPCPICSKKVKPEGMRHHVQNQHPNSTAEIPKYRFQCHLCPTMLKHRRSLQSHLETQHEDLIKEQCVWCTQRLLPTSMELHIRMHHPFLEDLGHFMEQKSDVNMELGPSDKQLLEDIGHFMEQARDLECDFNVEEVAKKERPSDRNGVREEVVDLTESMEML